MKQLNIILKGRGWNLAPTTGESWGIPLTLAFRPVDVIFEMHDIDGEYLPGIPWIETPRFINAYRKAKENNVLVYGLKEYEFEGLEFKKYPIREILDEFGETLFNCSMDYMLAYAIYKKYEQIDVYGANLAMDEEYYYQRPGVEFWRGYARGKGIDIKFHGPTTVGKCKGDMVYGYKISQDEFLNE